jgi:manganese transport protein
MLGVILLGFLYDTFRVGGDAGDVARGFIPGFEGSESVLFATGILGATVMPHVIYLHSALTQNRVEVKTDDDKRRVLRYQRVDVMIAMSLAGIANMAMLVLAASLFHVGGTASVDTLEEAYTGFETLAGHSAAIAFAVALLVAGFASSSVGTLAGQVVMQGFIGRQIPIFLRRLVTMLPALIVLAIGVDPTRALVLSQVALSFGIPFALIPLVMITRRPDVMGVLVNRRLTTVVAGVVAALIVALNAFLVVQTFGVV